MRQYLPRRYEGPPYDHRYVQRPIFGLDIDGTLGYYHEHFWAFAQNWTGKHLPHPDYFKGGSFAAHLGMSKATYRKIKLAYRRGGAKRSMPVMDGARALSRSLRQRGAVVVLCTTRPYLSLEGIDEDTRHWASRNKVQYDFIIWGERKYQDLARFQSRVVAVLEDEPQMLQQALNHGLIAVRRSRPYNHTAPSSETVSSLFEASHVLHGLLDDWEKENR